MSSGYFRHDTEDKKNNNEASPDMVKFLRIPWDRNYITVYYCTKTSAGSSTFEWPAGSYCIGRYGGVCPDGFMDGSIRYDDEDRKNGNKKQNPVPDYSQAMDSPQFRFCCRSDGRVSEPMFLPPDQPFGLWRHDGKCQEVKGMTEREWLVHYDSSNRRKDVSSCGGKHPDNDNCSGRDMYMWYCSYNPDVGLIQGADAIPSV